jgi:ketosteroid isomerase-like protein
VVIVDRAALQELMKRGSVITESRVDLARSAIGMAVKAGAPRRDIGTVEAFRRALLSATSIAYSASVSGDYLSKELFQKLGIADQVLPRSRRIVGERVGAVVARGDAEIGFQQISELLPIAGIDYVGPLPLELQKVTVFSAGIAASSWQPDRARDFIGCLASREAAATVAATGLEPRHAVPGVRPEFRELARIGPFMDAQTRDSAADEAAIQQLEQRLAKAWVERDRAFIEQLLADEWTVIDPSGRILTKTQVLDETFGSADRRIDSMTVDEVKVRLLGGAAVATGRTRATGSYRGQTGTATLRFTDVFQYRDGRWQIVASQGTAVTP